MKLLAIETSTEACSVAVLADGQVFARHELAPRRHTQLVLPWADELLAEAGLRKSQLDAIAVGRGPGAFTGVRLAIALVQGLALALDRPVLPVSTLAVLAMQGQGDDILAAIDARMGEVYLGEFARDADGLVTATGEEIICPPARAPLPAAGPGTTDPTGRWRGGEGGARGSSGHDNCWWQAACRDGLEDLARRSLPTPPTCTRARRHARIARSRGHPPQLCRPHCGRKGSAPPDGQTLALALGL